MSFRYRRARPVTRGRVCPAEDAFGLAAYARPLPLVLSLMYPSRTRASLSVFKTENDARRSPEPVRKTCPQTSLSKEWSDTAPRMSNLHASGRVCGVGPVETGNRRSLPGGAGHALDQSRAVVGREARVRWSLGTWMRSIQSCCSSVRSTSISTSCQARSSSPSRFQPRSHLHGDLGEASGQVAGRVWHRRGPRVDRVEPALVDHRGGASVRWEADRDRALRYDGRHSRPPEEGRRTVSPSAASKVSAPPEFRPLRACTM